MRRLRVITKALLEHAGERREHQRAIDALLVHELDPRTGLAECWDRAHGLTEERTAVLPLGVAMAEVLLHRPRPGDDIERRVRDVVADATVDDDLRAPPHVDIVHDTLVPVG